MEGAALDPSSKEASVRRLKHSFEDDVVLPILVPVLPDGTPLAEQ